MPTVSALSPRRLSCFAHTCQTLPVMLLCRTVGLVRGASHFGPADWSLHRLTRKGDNQDMASSLTSGTRFPGDITAPKPGLSAFRFGHSTQPVPNGKPADDHTGWSA